MILFVDGNVEDFVDKISYDGNKSASFIFLQGKRKPSKSTPFTYRPPKEKRKIILTKCPYCGSGWNESIFHPGTCTNCGGVADTYIGGRNAN